jgi:selenocysteine lyase/cysteine desulfurase
MSVTRREALAVTAALAVPAGTAAAAIIPSGLAADDEITWAKVAAQYPVTRQVALLENAYWGSMALPVAAAHRENVARLNRDNSWYARRAMVKDQQRALERAAEAMGVLPEEIGLCRNAAEGLSALIGQFRDVGAGDRILFSDTDYETTQGAMRTLAAARGAEAVKINLPRRMTPENLIETYREAIMRTPRLKLVLLTHMSHRHGLVLPVQEITKIARSNGIEVIVDCAQSFYQLPFKIPDFGANFVGMNFHKWVGAPLGAAAIWIRRGRTDAISPAPALPDAPATSVPGRIHQGTVDYAAQLTIPAALDFQQTIDPAAKLARLRYLRDRWVGQVRGRQGIEILLPDDPELYGATTSFRLAGRSSLEASIAVTDELIDRFGIMTVHRAGLADGVCIRVTPSLFTTTGEVDRLAAALTAMTG